MVRFQVTRKKKDELYGKKAELKTFYENLVDTENGPKWVEWAPPAFPQQKRTKWEGYAIQEYMTCDNWGDPSRAQSFSRAHIRILSPPLRLILEPLLEPHGISFSESENMINIPAPLQCLYYERHKIQELYEEAEPQTKEHLAVLLNLMRDELGKTIEETERLDAQNQITYPLLWTLFPAGTLVLQRTPEGEHIYQGYRATSAFDGDGGTRAFSVSCEYIRFDGVCYGTVRKSLEIPYFTDERDITSLPVFPLDRLQDQEGTKQRMIERGTRVLEFQDHHYMRYLSRAPEYGTGSGGSLHNLGSVWDKQGDMRIMIDFQLSRRRGMTQKVSVLPGYYTHGSTDREENQRAMARRQRVNLLSRRFSFTEAEDKETEDRRAIQDFRRLTLDEQSRNRKIVSKSDENLLILDPYLDGFSLASKAWKSFNIERVQGLDLNDDAFNFLVHSEGNKSLVCALVDDHAEHSSSLMQDVIAGKGQGLLILLSGSPGTGKTLMAEAIADKTKRPLYYVDSRDLGAVDMIESSLSEKMADVAAWNAILLLDEADVYLQKRSVDSLDRNKLVAVFLRLLEYYKGIMFLTTNLWQTIDEAIESRIQVHLKFPVLDHDARSQIWQNFLQKQNPGGNNNNSNINGNSNSNGNGNGNGNTNTNTNTNSNTNNTAIEKLPSNKDITSLGEWVINGRQIGNVLKIALAWSRQKEKAIDLEMLEQIIPASCPKAYKEPRWTEEARLGASTTAANKSNGEGGKEGCRRKDGMTNGNFAGHGDDMNDLLI